MEVRINDNSLFKKINGIIQTTPTPNFGEFNMVP